MRRYQTSWRRFWAGLVDGFVFVPLNYLDDKFLSPERLSWIIVSWAALAYSSYWLYSVVLHARFGQTLGKYLVGAKVLDALEQQIPTFRQALLRDIGLVTLNTASLIYLIYLVYAGAYTRGAEAANTPGLVLTLAGLAWFVLELLTMLTNEKRRAFHDYIAGTVVVRAA